MIPSIPKFIGLILIIWVVWTAFRVFETWQASIRSKGSRRPQGEEGNNPKKGNGGQSAADDNPSVDLRECEICVAWVSGKNCGRQNCPY